MSFNRGWRKQGSKYCVSNSKHERIRTMTQMWAEFTARSNFTPCFQVYIAEQMADMSRQKQSGKCRGACHEMSRNQMNSSFPLLKVWKRHPNKFDLSFSEVRSCLWSVFLREKIEWGEKQVWLSSLSGTPSLFFSIFLGTTAGPELFLAVLLSIFSKLPVFRHLMGKDHIKTQRVGMGRRSGTQVGRLLLISNAMRTLAAFCPGQRTEKGQQGKECESPPSYK